MWFKSVYLKSLRDFRIAIVGWCAGMGLLLSVVLAAVPALVATPQARASLVRLSGSFAWLAEPIAVDTPGGYTTWKYCFTSLRVALWPLLVCSREKTADFRNRICLDISSDRVKGESSALASSPQRPQRRHAPPRSPLFRQRCPGPGPP